MIPVLTTIFKKNTELKLKKKTLLGIFVRKLIFFPFLKVLHAWDYHVPEHLSNTHELIVIKVLEEVSQRACNLICKRKEFSKCSIGEMLHCTGLSVFS